jgi:hypothetical protein
VKNSEITDPLFREAVEAIDAGDMTALENLLQQHPKLIATRLHYPEGYYFKDPYLLWFVADNPIRMEKLPPNIVDITSLLIETVKRQAPDSLQLQLDYTLALVATGRIPREYGVQIAMMDRLIDAGAKPGDGLGALAHGNLEAAAHLLQRGGNLILAVAVGLDRVDDATWLVPIAGKAELLTALTVAAFYGNEKMIAFLLGNGADPNCYPAKETGFHTHATPLHQAVYSGSLASVKLLVDAGAKLDMKDKVYQGTPLGWAEYMPTEDGYDDAAKQNFAIIAAYLREKSREG